jgi:hypothetical protein
MGMAHLKVKNANRGSIHKYENLKNEKQCKNILFIKNIKQVVV